MSVNILSGPFNYPKDRDDGENPAKDDEKMDENGQRWPKHKCTCNALGSAYIVTGLY